ncbi:MAG: hypothetical protein FRX49_12836 [Trebouxia sp. A1-2]|nr:MAG: hypothetical protein FRX49_12836 [Trebouxia sp. A1-2]
MTTSLWGGPWRFTQSTKVQVGQPLLLMKDVTDQTMSWVVRHGEVQVQVLYGYINPAGTLKRMSITPSRREMHVDMQQEVHQQTARLNKQAPTFAAAVQQPSAQQQHAVKLDKDLIGLLRCTVGQSSLGRVRVVVAEPVVRQGVGVGARGHLTPLQALREVTLHPKLSSMLTSIGKVVARSSLPTGFTVMTARYHIIEHAQASEMANGTYGL